MAKKISFEAVYPYERDQVWVALTDPNAIAEWLMPNTFEPRVGHEFTFTTKPAPGFDGIVQAKVLTVDPPNRLEYSWKGGGIDTVVRWVLQAEGTSTRLFMEQDGFSGLKGFMISRLLAGGWKRMVHERLPAAVGRVSDGRYIPAPDDPLSQCHD